MIIRGLHIVPNPSIPEGMDNLADRSPIHDAPHQPDPLLALPFIKRSPSPLFRDQLDTTDCTRLMILGIFGVAQRAILDHDSPAPESYDTATATSFTPNSRASAPAAPARDG